jgi:hypothetical protein
MVNKSIKETDQTISDGKARCPQKPSDNEVTHYSIGIELGSLINKIIQANRASSKIKSVKSKALKVFHQNIPGLKTKETN